MGSSPVPGHDSTVVYLPRGRPVDGGGGGDDINGMALGERIAKLEASFEGLRHSQNLMIAVMGIGFALVASGMGYLATRVDNLPGELHAIADSISQAVTASKQAPPQVILMPAPSQAPETK